MSYSLGQRLFHTVHVCIDSAQGMGHAAISPIFPLFCLLLCHGIVFTRDTQIFISLFFSFLCMSDLLLGGYGFRLIVYYS